MKWIAALVLALPLACQAQPSTAKPARIGFLALAPLTSVKASREALLAGLRELGYVEGKNIRIDMRSADGDYARLAVMAAELVRERPDLIMGTGTPGTQALKAATSTIPIVMIAAGDPVGSKLVASLARPGGNITGTSNVSPELMKKRLELLLEAKPGIRRIAVLLNPTNPAQSLSFDAVQSAAQSLKVEALRVDVRNLEDIRAAFPMMEKRRIEAIILGNDTMLLSHSKVIADLALEHRVLSAGDRQFVDAGCLIGYGSTPEVWRYAATYVDKILKGAKPADLPIEQPRNIELVVNLKTSKALGLALPVAFRSRIDRVIE